MLWPTLLAAAATAYLVARIVVTLRLRDAPGTGPITPTPLPPEEVTPGTAAQLLRGVDPSAGTVAEVLDLAVKGVWRVGVRDDGGHDTCFVRRDQPYELILPDVPQAVYRAVFGPGDMALSRNLPPAGTADDVLDAGFADAVTLAGREVERRGWVRRHARCRALLNLAGQVLMVAAIAIPVTDAVITEGQLVAPHLPDGLPLIVYGGLVGLFSQFARVRPWTLTAEGRRVADRLAGVRGYLSLPEGRRTESVDTHERLLPYAVLFGDVPRWVRTVRADHERRGTKPEWMQREGHGVAADASVWDTLGSVGPLRTLGA